MKEDRLRAALLVLLFFWTIHSTCDASRLGAEIKSFVNKNLEFSGRCGKAETLASACRIPLETIKGNYPARLPALGLHIRQRDLARIRDGRARAFHDGILHFKDERPLVYTFQGETGRGKIQLKGLFADHWSGEDRWTFRIRVRDGKGIDGFRRFAIQKPECRQFPYDYLFHAWMSLLGNITPEFGFFRVSVNGRNWGIMLAEEMFGVDMVERRRRKESVCFTVYDDAATYYSFANRKHGNPVDPAILRLQSMPRIEFYDDKNLRSSRHLGNLAGYCKRGLDDFLQGRVAPSEFLDVESFSRAFLVTLATQNSHAMWNGNAKFYLNPYTLRVEIVMTDFGLPYPWSPAGFRSLQNPAHFTPSLYPFQSRLLLDPPFLDACRKALPLLRRTWREVPERTRAIREVFPAEHFDFAKLSAEMERRFELVESGLEEILRNLADHSRSGLDSIRGEAAAAPVPARTRIFRLAHAYLHDSGTLEIATLVLEPLAIESGSFELSDGSRIPLPIGPMRIEPGHDGIQPGKVEVPLPSLPEDANARLELAVSTPHHRETCEVGVRLGTRTENPFLRGVSRGDRLPLTGRASFTGSFLELGSGEIHVAGPVILPAGVGLRILPGTSIRASTDACFLVRGPLLAEGTERSPINLQPDGSSWKGIYVCEAGSLSRMSHVTIAGARAFQAGALELTGGVTFYRSPVDMDFCRIESSFAEDGINLVHSEFSLREVEFRDCASDALDCDYCAGTIRSCRGGGISGDVIDLSGSEVEIEGLEVSDIGDKALSVGEGSRAKVTALGAARVGTGIAVKDGSSAVVEGLRVRGARVNALMVYTKKHTFHERSELIVGGTDLADRDVSLQRGHRCRLNGRELAGTSLDVDALYNNGPMSKDRP